MILYKYQGAGNDFLIADNRKGNISLGTEEIRGLCDRRYGIGADGLMLLENEPGYDFRMIYYNSDGSGGMMCGNGGRCIVAFAYHCGLRSFHFTAADGPHTATVLENGTKSLTVRLKMKDFRGMETYPDGVFLDTGTRHFVRFTNGLEGMDIIPEGRRLRSDIRFAPAGTNVNFVEPSDALVRVRTFEKGVEDETYACGTGIVASVLATWFCGKAKGSVSPEGRVRYAVRALRDNLEVDFIPGQDCSAKEIFLTGPATLVAAIDTDARP